MFTPTQGPALARTPHKLAVKPPPPQNLNENNYLGPVSAKRRWSRRLRTSLACLLALTCAVLAQPANAQAADVTLLVSPISLTERADSTTVTVTAARVGSDTSGAVTVTLALPASYTPLLTANTKLATKDTDYTTTFSSNTITIADGSASGTVTFAIDPTYDTDSEGDETIIMTGTSGSLTVTPTELIVTDGPYLSFPKFIYGHLYYPAASVDITVPEAINKAGSTSTVTYALVKTEPSTDPFNLTFAAGTRKLTGTIPAAASIPTAGSTVRYTIRATDDSGFTETTIVSVSAVKNVCDATSAGTGWKTKITATSGTQYNDLVANCNILLATKDTLRGTAGGSLNWATTTDIRSWDGVCFKSQGISGGKTACTDTDVTGDGDWIRHLFFHRRSLKGTIPPVLGNLTGSSLTNLHLGDDWLTPNDSTENQLTGPIPPEFGNLTVTVIALKGNKLTGTIPRELTSNGSLLYLYASDTGASGLSGSIPPEFGTLQMRALNATNNNLTGTVPWQLGQNSKLQVLNLAGNDLSGTISWQLGGFGLMQYFALSGNTKITGSISWQLGNLGVTETRPIAKMRLRLNDMGLTGSIPPQLGNISKLTQLYLHNNQLSGAIPSTWGTASHPLSELAQLYLADNSLCLPASRKTWYETGTLSTDPLFLCSVPSAQLYTRNEAIPVLSLSGGGTTPTLTASPALPSGLAFDTSAGTVQGTPTAVHRSQVHRITVADGDSSVTHPIELTVVAQQAVTVADPGQPSDSDITLVTAETPPPRAGAGPRMRVIMKTNGGQEVAKDVQYNPPASLCLPVPATLSLSSAALYRYTGSGWQRESAEHKTTTAGEVCADVADLSHSVFTVGPYSSTVTGGDGTDTGTATDQHGNTPATATAVSVESRQTARRGTRTAGQINSRTDTDYFQLSVPQAGWLVLETTGFTNTHGTLWEAEALLNETSALQTGGLHLLTQAANHVEPLAQDDDSGTRRNFYIPLHVTPGDYLLAVTGVGSSVGAYTLRSTLVAGWLDNPRPASHQSGISVLSGWLCAADSVVFEVNDTLELEAAYGTDRPDTADQCDETDTGFGLLFNWNRLGDGEHTVTLVVDDIALETFPITVTTLGEEFRTELSGSATLTDFPTEGETARLVWQEALQNFALASGQGGGSGTHRDPDQAVLENPQPGSYQSGISVLSGWACEAETVVLEVDGALLLPAGYGTERTDTVGKCGDTDNGFGVLFNWNRLGDGKHTVRLLVDGEEWATATFTVTTLGEETLRGLNRTAEVADFPSAGETVTVEWQEAQQNFVITDWQRGEDPSP